MKTKRKLSTEFYLLLFLLAACAFLAVFAKGFYSVNNLMSILNSFSYILISAIGMNLIMLTGNIDVSTGALISVVALSLAAIGKMGVPFAGLLLAGMLIGAVLSTFNGVFITGMKIPAIVATLATTQIFQGILPLTCEGSIYDLPASFTWLAFEAKLFGIIPGSLILCLIVVIVFLLFVKYSKFAKKLYAIGNNKEGARLCGIKVDKTIIICYAIAGALFGITALIVATASQRCTTTMGTGMEMTFIAAVVLGGTSSAGGSGKLQGTIIGALILAMVAPAITYLGISSDWSDAVKGAIILLSVIVGESKNIKRKRVIAENAGGEA